MHEKVDPQNKTLDIKQASLELEGVLNEMITFLESLERQQTDEIKFIRRLLVRVHEGYLAIAENLIQDSRILNFFLHELRNRTSNVDAILYGFLNYKLSPKKFNSDKEIALRNSLYIRDILLINLTELASRIDLKDYSMKEVYDYLDFGAKLPETEILLNKYRFNISIFTMMLILAEIKINAVHKHRARSLSLRLRLEGNKLLIEIKDDGEGISPLRLQKINENLKNPSEDENIEIKANSEFGLQAIRRLGVEVNLSSKGIDKGTTLTLGFEVIPEEF